jgi:hypothetical protein
VFIVVKVVKRGRLEREGRVVEGEERCEEQEEVGVGLGEGAEQQPIEMEELYAVVNKGPRQPI